MECAICLAENISNNNLSITSCNHNFCYDCLNNWFKTNHITCPICRKNIDFFKYNNEINKIIHIYSNNNDNIIRNNNIITNNNNENNNNDNENIINIITNNIIRNNNNISINYKLLILLKILSISSLVFVGSTTYLLIDCN